MDAGSLIRDFIADRLGVVEANEIAEDTPLVQNGVIDSIELMQIVAFLEKQFSITIDDTEIVPQNFRNIEAMKAYLAQKTGSS